MTPNKPLSREVVDANCPAAKVCGFAESCTLALIYENCALFRDRASVQTKEVQPLLDAIANHIP